ncbi:UbiH/UbiF/VisC/COQ6 family ubiquinone biosynthesis hydroxylase [Pseudomonadota bacterium]
MIKKFDIVVIGGGMVGTSFAALLQDSGLNIAVVEPNRPPKLTKKYALRVSAISAGSDRLLRNVGAWEKIANRRVSPYQHMVVWDAGSKGSIQFDASEFHQPYLGHIIENDLIVSALWQTLLDDKNISLLQGESLQGFEQKENGLTVDLASGLKIHTQLLVGADGGNSRVRNLANIGVKRKAYDQLGIVANIQTEKPHLTTAWQRFLETGPIAMLPLADGSCSIVWSCDTATAEHLLQLDPQAFEQRLGDATEMRLGEVKLRSDRKGFELQYAQADHYIAEHLALIGDAAHSVHPLAGQGVNLGFADAAALAHNILDSKQRRQNDWCTYTLLRAFERWRKGENQISLTAMDTFKRVFGSRRATVKTLRGIGLDIADSITPLKHQLMGRALGIAGDLPDVVRDYRI